MTFNRIIEKLEAQGIHCYKSGFAAGLYFDGKQHGEEFDCIFVSVDKDDRSDSSTIEKLINKAIKRYSDLTVKSVFHPFYYSYRIAAKESFERAKELEKVSKTFLDGFWQEIHVNPHARDNDSEAAIKAGRARLIQAGFEV